MTCHLTKIKRFRFAYNILLRAERVAIKNSNFIFIYWKTFAIEMIHSVFPKHDCSAKNQKKKKTSEIDKCSNYKHQKVNIRLT